MAEAHKLVVFENTAKSYPTDAHVECSFTIKHPFQPSNYDWIGLFRVPWSSVKDKYYYYYVPLSSEWKDDADKSGSVLFQSNNMPGEDGEYYQFVYFDGKGHMRGASTPFTFRRLHADDLIEEVMTDDSDMLFITTRQTQLEMQISEVQAEKDDLRKKCCELQLQAEELQLMVEAERAKKTQSDIKIKELQANLKDAVTETQATVQMFDELSVKSAALKRELEAKCAEKEELEKRMVMLKNEVDTLSGEISGMRREKEMYVHHASESESSKKRVQEQMMELQQRLEHHRYTSDDIATLEIKVASAEENLIEKERIITERETEVGVLTCQLEASNLRHEVETMEISTLRESFSDLSQRYEEVNTKNDEIKDKFAKAKRELKVLNTEKKDWTVTLDENTKKMNNLLSTIAAQGMQLELAAQQEDIKRMDDDRYFALQTAYQMVKEELSDANKKIESKSANDTRVRESEKLATRKVQELQQKLKAGENEWTKMTEKCVTLERKLARANKRQENPLLNIFSGFPRTGTNASSLDLTKEELQTMVQQLSGETERLNRERDRYRQKYLDEKQRMSTLKDYCKTEQEKHSTDLALARSVIDVQLQSPVTPEPLTPIVYPPVKPQREGVLSVRSKEPTPFQYPGIGDTSADNTGARSPMEVGCQNLMDYPLSPDESLPKPLSEMPSTSAIGDEADGSDSDEDNVTDRFHDAMEIPSMDGGPPESCCMCHTKFDPADDVNKRCEHVNTHLQSIACDVVDDEVHFKCPICEKVFERATSSDDDLQNHMETHFNEEN